MAMDLRSQREVISQEVLKLWRSTFNEEMLESSKKELFDSLAAATDPAVLDALLEDWLSVIKLQGDPAARRRFFEKIESASMIPPITLEEFRALLNNPCSESGGVIA